MLRNVKDLEKCAISATDGDIGHVDQFFFDDLRWVIRYLVVEAGTWLLGRRVLISPIAVGSVDREARRLHVALTREQVRDSPDIDTQKPVSRQHEVEYYDYYGWPYYWAGTGLWGFADIPLTVASGRDAERDVDPQAAPAKESVDPHLRSTNEVTGYHIDATDGEIGHVDDLVVDDETWAIRYLSVDTRNWWPGKKVLVAPQWVVRVSWADSKVEVDLSRDAIKNGPAYDPTAPITRDYEARLYEYYSRPTYWGRER